MRDTCINIVFEDVLSGAVLMRLLATSSQQYKVGLCYNTRGFGSIKQKINAFNHAAKGMPYLVLTDLDRNECAPILIQQWLTGPRHPNLIFRVAVREVEAWLLGCRELFSAFLGVPTTRIPSRVDDILDPKEFVVNLARRSRKRDIRNDVAPEPGSTAKVGPDYNGRVMYFVETSWDPAIAGEHSASLRKAIEALEAFQPEY